MVGQRVGWGGAVGIAMAALWGCGEPAEQAKDEFDQRLGGAREDSDGAPRKGDETPSDDPCATVRCAAGTQCEAVAEDCGKEPCPLRAQCVPAPDRALSCASVLCKVGTVCTETASGPVCLPGDEDPCNLVDCQPGSTCTVEDGEAVCKPAEQGQPCGDVVCGGGFVCCNASCGICTPPDGACIQRACEPGGTPGATCADTLMLCDDRSECVDGPEGPTCAPREESPCNLVDCPPSAPNCHVVDGEAVCVADGVLGACALALCPLNTYCDDISGEAKCLPLPSCRGMECAPGTSCELVEVQCIRAPCPPQPTCLPADPCATVRCKRGYHCEAVDVQCVTTPCDPVAECVPDGKGPKCGPNTCAKGEVCCNESCGICTAPDGFCTEQYCGATTD